MTQTKQSETAMNYLKDKIVHGKPLRIIRSKHQHVQMPKEGQEAANLTQDYTNSPLHRFKKPGSKNFQVRFSRKFIFDNLKISEYSPALGNIAPVKYPARCARARIARKVWGHWNHCRGLSFFPVSFKISFFS